MRGRRGLTLLELLFSVVIVGGLMLAITRVYAIGYDTEARLMTTNSSILKIRTFEDRLIDLLQHARLSTDTNSTSSFFIGGVGNGQDITAVQGAGNADTIIFTTTGTRVPDATMNSTDDFETQNQNFGPQGGVAEIDISKTPIGSPTQQNDGDLYIREQRPADGDPTQGGYETVMQSNVDTITYEFFDGSDWQTTWDTRTMGTARLPAAIRVTYRMIGDTQDHIFVVRVPQSDVTTQNPVQQGTTTQ